MERLWIISELFPPEETSTAYIMGEIASALSEKYDVNVICGPEIYDADRRRKSNGAGIHDKYNVIRTETHSYNKNSIKDRITSACRTTLALYRLAKQHIKEGDNVLMVTNPAPLIPLICRLKTKRNFKLNILVHDVFPENTKAAGIRLPLYEAIKRIYDRAYRKADKLIVLGRDMADVMSKKTQNRPECRIIENWGDFEEIRMLPMPDGDRVIVQYAGNIGRVQGLDRIVRELPDNVDLHFYGSGAMEDTLKNYNRPNVFFHGPYSRSEQTEILGKCHISLVTLNEKMYGLGTPSKAYNILASGRPIIYFGPQKSEIELLIKQHNIGFCGWPDRWNIEELRDMGRRARQVGENLFSKQLILTKFADSL